MGTRHYRQVQATETPEDFVEFPSDPNEFRAQAIREARALLRHARRLDYDLEELVGVGPRIRDNIRDFCRHHPEERARFIQAFRYRALILRFVRRELHVGS